MSCAMRRLRKSPSRWHGGAEGELRAGSGAMRWLRLVYELRISRICAEAQRGAAARIHARCRGGDWFMSYGFRGFPASQAHMGAEGELPRGFMRDAEAATIFLCIE